jgi:serine/threonine-protein kinase
MDSTLDEGRIDDLLLSWDEARKRGHILNAEELCADCPTLAGELNRRIAALKRLGDFFDDGLSRPFAATNVASDGNDLLAEVPTDRESAECRARYGALRFHARGGIGEVFLAVGDDLNREVALKFMKSERAGDADSRRRFLLEAEVTGRLEHPGVVPVYGLGVDAGGAPCYAMRFVRGETLDDAIHGFHAAESPSRIASDKALAFRGLLRRFVSVCNTIGYAHSRGVLHRDIKPRNVMLGKFDETLVVDWGLAKPFVRSKIEGARVSGEESLRPASAEALGTPTVGTGGTPQYMSPEQADGRWYDVGPLSDVYSLGATLYVLLTGVSAFPSRSIAEVIARVRRGHFASPRGVKPSVPRALEAICLKAMALKPEDRYASALELATDVERWLADEPVLAYREGLSLRVARWARRNRVRVQTGIAAVCLIAVVATAAAFAINVARRETAQALASESRAKFEAEENFRLARNAVQEYLTNVSENALLKQQDRADLRVLRKQLLESALKYYETFIVKHGSDLGVKEELADAYSRVGSITSEIGSKEEALRSYERALEIRQTLTVLKPNAPLVQRDLARAYSQVGDVQRALGRSRESLHSHEQALETRLALARTGSETAGLQDDLANNYLSLGSLQGMIGQPSQALSSYERALEILRRLVDADPSDKRSQDALAKVWLNMGNLHRRTAHYPDAMNSYQQARALWQRLAETDPYDPYAQRRVADCHFNIGVLQSDMGLQSESLRSNERAIEIRRKLVDEHPSVTVFQDNLSAAYTNLGNQQIKTGLPSDALKSFERAAEIKTRLGAANPNVPEFQADLALILTNMGYLQKEINGRADEALTLYKQALGIRQKLVDKAPEVTRYQNDLASILLNLGSVQQETGRTAEASRSYEQALGIWRKLAQTEPATTEFQENQAFLYINIGNLSKGLLKTREALSSYEQALAIREGLATAHPNNAGFKSQIIDALIRIAALHREAGQTGLYRQSLEKASAVLESLPAPRSVDLYDHACVLALLSALPGTEGGHRAYADRAVQVLRRAVGAGYRNLDHIAKDTDLDHLRSRPDFQLLMMDLGFPADPFR